MKIKQENVQDVRGVQGELTKSHRLGGVSVGLF